MRLAWGNKVSEEFRKLVISWGEDTGLDPSWLMACMAFETGETFRSDIANAAGSGAVGLIQFMPSTATAMGTSTAALKSIPPEVQLRYVFQYFKPYLRRIGSLEDMYMAVLWPAAVGQPQDHVLFRKGDRRRPKAYLQNRGLDWNQDGVITKAEASAKVRSKLERGFRPENVWKG